MCVCVVCVCVCVVCVCVCVCVGRCGVCVNTVQEMCSSEDPLLYGGAVAVVCTCTCTCILNPEY